MSKNRSFLASCKCCSLGENFHASTLDFRGFDHARSETDKTENNLPVPLRYPTLEIDFMAGI